MYFFSSNVVLAKAWTQVMTAADSESLGNAIALLTDPGTAAAAIGGSTLGNRTNVAEGIDRAREGIAGNSFEGTRKVIDVSGDGKQNTARAGGAGTGGSDCTEDTAGCNAHADLARDAASAAGIVVNGLAITDDVSDLATWYSSHIKTGTGSFVLDATFLSFAKAIETKIGREITGDVPAPATLAVFGAALLGLAGLRRRA